MTPSRRDRGAVTAPYRSVSRSSPVPLYHQVASDLRHRVERGEWATGEKIPTETALCEHYEASRITIRRALGDLVAEGLLVRAAGRGTFVREPTVTAGPRGLTSFTEEMAGLGLRAGARVVRVERIAAPDDVAERLGLGHGDEVVAITRLRTGDGKPIGVQTAYLPARFFPGLERVRLGDRSLYGQLAERYGVRPVEAEEVFDVGTIRKQYSQLLEVRPGACAFHVQRLTYDADGRRIELVQSVMRGDRYRIRLGLRSLGPPR